MQASDPREPPPDPQAALAQYRRRASVYDLELKLFEPMRQAAVARLALQRGDAVLDLGCGTGLSLPLLRHAVGSRGRIVGIEQCPEMLALARQRVQQHGWRNVTLILAPVADARIARIANAALFHFTHDILRDARALDNVALHLQAGARVVACGLQWAQGWAWPVNLFVLGAALHSVSSLDHLARPWSLLAERLAQVQVESMLGGAVFLANGLLRPAAVPATPGAVPAAHAA